jgi:uncharacterized protein (TIGR00725 family)
MRKVTVGVMGSAGGEFAAEVLERCRELGREIARRDCIIVTGACPGLPHHAVLGAKEEGGLVLGVSPAVSLYEHVEYYRSPHTEYDFIVFTGSGLMGREVAAIRSCDIVIVVGGRSGTLGEFAIAYDEGKLIGALQDTHGIADHVEELVRMVNKKTDAEVLVGDDPGDLLDRCLRRHWERLQEGTYCKGPLRDV